MAGQLFETLIPLKLQHFSLSHIVAVTLVGVSEYSLLIDVLLCMLCCCRFITLCRRAPAASVFRFPAIPAKVLLFIGAAHFFFFFFLPAFGPTSGF